MSQDERATRTLRRAVEQLLDAGWSLVDILDRVEDIYYDAQVQEFSPYGES